MNLDFDTIIENAKKRIEYVQSTSQNQTVVLTINKDGEVIHMHNAWNSPKTMTQFDPKNPCDFATPINKGKKITWIGNSYPENAKDLKIEIDYVLMNNAKGKQLLKNKSYNRGKGSKVVGEVKNKIFNKGDIEYYYIVYSVNDKAYILDPRMEPHGETL